MLESIVVNSILERIDKENKTIQHDRVLWIDPGRRVLIIINLSNPEALPEQNDFEEIERQIA